MQLLVGHGPDQRLERSSLRLRIQGASTDPLDEATHHGIRLSEAAKGFWGHGCDGVATGSRLGTQAADFIGNGDHLLHIPHIAGELQLADTQLLEIHIWR